MRAIIQTLPYSDLPKKIQITLIKYVVSWLNNTLKENQSLTPREMILGEQILDCKNICKIPFGSYVQVHEDQHVTNTMESRKTGAICLGPSNMNGGYNFFSLETGEIIIRRNWTELPVPMDVVSRLKEMSNGRNSNIEEILEDKLPSDEWGLKEDAEEEKEILNNNASEEEEMIITEENHVGNVIKEEFDFSGDRDGVRVKENGDFGLILDDKEEETRNNESPGIIDMVQEKENHEPLKRYNLRPNQTPNYSHRFALLSVHAGVRKWGEKAREAICDELKMLKKENVFKEVSNPTAEQVKKALMTHCFVMKREMAELRLG